MNTDKCHPVIKEYLKKAVLTNMPPLCQTPIEKSRQLFNKAAIDFDYPPLKGPKVLTKDSFVTLTDKNIAIRTYRREQNQKNTVFLFFHGGGFVLGNLDTLDWHCKEIVSSIGCTLISVDYPLAPENPFPTPLNVCYEAASWASEAYKGLPLFVGGSSAGATLACAACLMAKDKGGPKLSGQVLLFPMTDTKFDTPSHIECGTGFNLTTDDCKWFYAQYARDEKDYENPYFAPLKTKDLSGLPKALVITAELDPLRDEGRMYAERLKNAKVDVTEKCYKGMTHGFSTIPLENLEERQEVLEKINTLMQ